MKQNSAKFDLLKQYLLGQLSEEEMQVIEQRYLADPEFFQHLVETEGELISLSLHGRLSPEEQTLFESHFSRSADRRIRIESYTD